MLAGFSSIAAAVEIMCRYWEICLLIAAAFAVLFIGLYKGFKSGLKAIVWVFLIAGAALLADLIVRLCVSDVAEMIDFLIAWVPTILFLFGLLAATLVGVWRGLRKSLILLVHAVCSAAVCIALYFACVSSVAVDEWVLNTVNTFMGGDAALQQALGVSSECATMREVLTEYFPQLIGNGSTFAILLQDSGAYIYTLADLAFHLGFAVVAYLCYYLLVFLLYIVYHIFYSERKYKKKKEADFANNETDRNYRPHRVGGGVVGFFRGLVVGIVSLSFVGSAFFIAAGGPGNGELADCDFGNPNANFAYSIYRSVESYGSQGIFKVLNLAKDPDDSPYYLFAADLVLSGELDDEIGEVKGNVKFRKELGAYVGFARETMNLLMKYGEEDLAPVLAGNVSADKMNRVTDVMSNPQFQLEFENLIDNFDQQTYLINFSLSLANTLIANLDNPDLNVNLSADNKELLQILFRKGYLSENIPEEKRLRIQSGSSVTTNRYEIPPHLSVNHVLDKQDARVVLRVVLSFLTGEVSAKDPLGMVKEILPQVEKLSILGTERKAEVNPVLGRLYCYLENRYLTLEGQEGIAYADIVSENVSWVDELHALVDVADDLIPLYDFIKNTGKPVLQGLLAVFDTNEKNYEENVAHFDGVCEKAADSVLLGKVFSSGYVMNYLQSQLKTLDEAMYVPEKIIFENKYDVSGKLVSLGETHQFFFGLRLLGKPENGDLVDMLLNLSAETDVMQVLEQLAAAFEITDEEQKTLSDYLTDSVLLRSVVSSTLIAKGGDVLKIPLVSRERGETGEPVNMIVKVQLKQLFDNMGEIVELVKPFAEGNFTNEDVVTLLNDDTFNYLLDSGNGIVEATAADVLIDRLEEVPVVVLPYEMKEYEGWVTTGGAGELRKMLAAIRTMNLDIAELVEGTLDGDKLIDTVRSMDEAAADTLLASEVLYFTVSDYLLKEGFGSADFTLVIPAAAKTVVRDGEEAKTLVSRSELREMLTDFAKLELTDEMTVAEIFVRLIACKDRMQSGTIMPASVVGFMVESGEVRAALSIPERYLNAGAPEQLASYGSDNEWYHELPALFNALDELFGVTETGEGATIDLAKDAVTKRMETLLQNLKEPAGSVKGAGSEASAARASKLDVCQSSVVFMSNLTEKLDNALKNVVDESVRNQAKVDGVYTGAELLALSNAVDIFGVDILKLEEDKISDKIKDNILKLNDGYVEYEGEDPEQTELEAIYPSAIIRKLIADELDKTLDETKISPAVLAHAKEGFAYPQSEIAALVESVKQIGNSLDDLDDYDFSDITSPDFQSKMDVLFESYLVRGMVAKQIDDALTPNLIDTDVREKIKDELVYTKDEVRALVKSFEEWGIISVYDIGTATFSNIKTFNASSNVDVERTRLDVLYDSQIVGGIITKTVRGQIEGNDMLADCDGAYLKENRIYRKREIAGLVTLFGDRDAADFEINTAEEIRQYVSADENGEPQSYLVAASVTKRLLNTANLVVPVSVMRDGVILPNHLTEILDAFTALHGNDNLSEWLVAEDLTVPAADRRAAIVKSTIMRASLTAQLAFHTERFTVAQSNVELSQDVYGRAVVIIDEQEMSALFTALDVLGVTGELKVPYYSSTDFREAGKYYYQLDTLYESSVMRYRFSDIWGTSGGEGAYESAFVLEKQSGGVVSNDVNKFVISLEKQKELLESYRPRN